MNAPAPLVLVCPTCGNANPPDAVFCEMCHKALGEFRYVREEFEAQTRRHEKIAERVAQFIGKPHFFYAHTVWISLWMVANVGLLMLPRFDAYPFNLLGIVLAVEALFITGFVLISQTRQAKLADLRAELDYEVNVRAFRELQETRRVLAVMQEQLNRLEGQIVKEVR